jgi:hypothetical protein
VIAGDPTNWAMAARGDLTALQMLRDTVLESEGLALEDRLAQGELLARLAAEVGGPMDSLALCSVLLLRSEASAMRRDGATDEADLRVHDYRSERYREQAEQLFPTIASGDDPEAAALLMRGLTIRADNGEDRALTLLQMLIDEMPTANLQAVKTAIRNLEQEIDA